MNVVFFLVRLVFFMIGILLLFVPVALALELAPLILLLALGLWLVMFVLVCIGAAFENSAEGIPAFIWGTGEVIREYSLPCIRLYFKAYKDLWKWLWHSSQSTIPN
jgi:hypothetical protein